MDFRNVYAQGFARIAACAVPVAEFDPATNAERILEQVRACDEQGVAVAVFPELSVSGYALDDLLLQDTLLDAVESAITDLVEGSEALAPLFVVGAPLQLGNRLFNCAVVIHRGRVLGVVPKSYLPNYREFYEKRWFAHGRDCVGLMIAVNGQEIPFGTDLIFAADNLPGFTFGIEICEDVWSPNPPGTMAALAGLVIDTFGQGGAFQRIADVKVGQPKLVPPHL